MFIKKTNESDFWAALENGIQNASFEEDLENEQHNKALNYLSSAATSLSSAGLKKEAETVVALKEICQELHAENLTSAKMIESLEKKGIMMTEPVKAKTNEDCIEVEDLAIL